MRRLLSHLTALGLTVLVLLATAPAHAADAALAAAIAGPRRSEPFKARDTARHPQQVLEFAGVRPDAAIVEIWPGGGYWTEILAPYLGEKGVLYAALPSAAAGPLYAPGRQKFTDKLTASPALYGKVRLAELGPDTVDMIPAGTADAVITFRNLHNWMADDYAGQALTAFYKALKPGGVLLIEDHRGAPGSAQDPRAKSGYVREDYAIALVRKAGFELVSKSEINANPRDTRDYPKGVWTLPPTYAMGDADRDKYTAIGEADNFLLKFVKPAH